MSEIHNHRGRNLLILSRCFPFNQGEVAAESYLETEIGLLADYFDQVVVMATEAARRTCITCNLPDNVRAVALNCGNSRIDKALEAAQGVVLRAVGPASIKRTFGADVEADTAKRRVFLGYIVARAYRKFKRIRRECGVLGFEPTHIYSFWFWDIAVVASWIKATYPCTFAFARAHGYDLYKYRSSLGYLPLREYLLSNLDLVLPCSCDGRAYIDENWPGYADKVRVAYLGTRDLPDRSSRIETACLRVMSCSRVVPVKRVVLIAKAMYLLDRDGVYAEWVHYGDGEGLEEIKKITSGLINVQVEFPGYLSNSKLLDEYCSRDFSLFVNVSESEGLPISIMEACGVGVPVLATNVGGTHEIVRPEINGCLLPKNITARRLADELKHFANLSNEEQLSLRKGAREVWDKSFRATNNVSKLVALLFDESAGI